VSREETIENAALQSFLNHFRKVGENYNKDLLVEVQRVSKEDIKLTIQKYFKPLFDPKVANTAIALNPSKVKETVEGFAALGRKLEESSLDAFFH